MKRFFEIAGTVMFFIGFGGVAGAIEMETSILRPLLIALLGIGIMVLLFRGDINEESVNYSVVNSSYHNASRPSYLR